jgi:hypothetical protein
MKVTTARLEKDGAVRKHPRADRCRSEAVAWKGLINPDPKLIGPRNRRQHASDGASELFVP